MSRRGTEEEQEQKRNGRRTAGKLVPKSALCENWQKLALVPILAVQENWHWCQFWPCRKIGIGANFGTMPIFGINFVRAGKLALVPILALCQFLALILALEQKLALVPILALVPSLACRKVGIGANFGTNFMRDPLSPTF